MHSILARISRLSIPAGTAPRPPVLAAALLTPLFLLGCAEAQLGTHVAKSVMRGADPGGVYKVGKPYEIFGVTYYPKEDPTYDRTGVASWYGPKFDGRRTANGEIFDQNLVTAAHPTLPMPTFARVTNLENGRALVVRINDRGPFAHGREIDLSRRAAQLLGFEKKGTTKVRVQYLGRAPLPSEADYRAPTVKMAEAAGRDDFYSPKPATPERERRIAAAPVTRVASASLAAPIASVTAAQASYTGGSAASQTAVAQAATPHATTMAPIRDDAQAAVPGPVRAGTLEQAPVPAQTGLYVQAGAFTEIGNAHTLMARLAPLGRAQIAPVAIDGTPFYRVQLGPLDSVSEADALLRRVIGNGHKAAKIIVQ